MNSLLINVGPMAQAQYYDTAFYNTVGKVYKIFITYGEMNSDRIYT